MNIFKEISSGTFDSVKEILEKYRPDFPICCLRPKQIENNARKFIDIFPGKVLYAVKCNPHADVLDACVAGGVRDFDVASLGEVELIRGRYSSAKIYFQHPIKARSAIRSSYQFYGVRHFAVDHPTELSKITEEIDKSDNVTIFVRLATPPGGAGEHLSDKFGASIKMGVSLLSEIYENGFNPAISFHVGSQCYDPSAFHTALSLVGETLDQSKVEITALDVGGGFPASYPKMETPTLYRYMKVIKDGVAALNLSTDTEVLCEPGRTLVADGMSVVVQVQLRRNESLYINDGVFGNFAESLLNQFELTAAVLRLDDDCSPELAPFTIYGPTCDSHDRLPMVVYLCRDVREGDWIEFSNLGAYSNAMATTFNGFFPGIFLSIGNG